MHIIRNAVLMALELAAIAATAWLGFSYPLLFAGLTAVFALALGVALEISRLQNEMAFYFDRQPTRLALFTRAVGSLEAFVKAALAGIVALLTFLGTDQDRLLSVAVIFAVTLFLGVQAVQLLTTWFRARPLRWGYFRLAAPLGIVFSLGQSFLPSPGLGELARRVTFDLPERPSIEQASEFLFLLKQSFDDIVARMLGWIMDPGLADLAGAIVSVNMLSGFVIALYAVLIGDGVRRLDRS